MPVRWHCWWTLPSSQAGDLFKAFQKHVAHSPSHAVFLSAASDSGRLRCYFSFYFCTAMLFFLGFADSPRCSSMGMCACAHQANARASTGASVHALWLKRSNITHSRGISLSLSLFLKLPHHAAPVDWRYSHIYYAGGLEMRTPERRGWGGPFPISQQRMPKNKRERQRR